MVADRPGGESGFRARRKRSLSVCLPCVGPVCFFMCIPTSGCAAFIKESRMKSASANQLDRKSGVRWGEHGAPVPGVRDSVGRKVVFRLVRVERADENWLLPTSAANARQIWGTHFGFHSHFGVESFFRELWPSGVGCAVGGSAGWLDFA